MQSGDTIAGAELGIGSSDLVALNDAGDVAFSWLLEPFVPSPFGANAGLYVADAGASVRTLMQPGVTPAPGGGVFAGARAASINDRGDVAFAGLVPFESAQGYGIFVVRRKGAIEAVVRPGDAAPGGGTFTRAVLPSLADGAGDIAFWARITGVTGNAAYVWRARTRILEPIARAGDPAPGGGVFLTTLFPPQVDRRGSVLFGALVQRPGEPPFSALYLASEGRIDPILQPSDMLPDGLRVESVGGVASLTDDGGIAFLARGVNAEGFADTAVYRWSRGEAEPVARNGLVPGLGYVTADRSDAAALIGNRGHVVFPVSLPGGRVAVLEASDRQKDDD